MKIKTIKLEWYALYWDWNSKKLKKTNVLREELKEEIYKKIKNNTIVNREDLKELVKRNLMYYYWSKAEYEVLVGGLHTHNLDDFEKIDVYSQLEPNLDNITDYIINKMEIVFERNR